MVTYRDRYWRPAQLERMYVKPGEDGHPHERDERGWCKTCMAPPGCSHARCVAKGVKEEKWH